MLKEKLKIEFKKRNQEEALDGVFDVLKKNFIISIEDWKNIREDLNDLEYPDVLKHILDTIMYENVVINDLLRLKLAEKFNGNDLKTSLFYLKKNKIVSIESWKYRNKRQTPSPFFELKLLLDELAFPISMDFVKQIQEELKMTNNESLLDFLLSFLRENDINNINSWKFLSKEQKSKIEYPSKKIQEILNNIAYPIDKNFESQITKLVNNDIMIHSTLCYLRENKILSIDDWKILSKEQKSKMEYPSKEIQEILYKIAYPIDKNFENQITKFFNNDIMIHSSLGFLRENKILSIEDWKILSKEQKSKMEYPSKKIQEILDNIAYPIDINLVNEISRILKNDELKEISLRFLRENGILSIQDWKRLSKKEKSKMIYPHHLKEILNKIAYQIDQSFEIEIYIRLKANMDLLVLTQDFLRENSIFSVQDWINLSIKKKSKMIFPDLLEFNLKEILNKIAFNVHKNLENSMKMVLKKQGREYVLESYLNILRENCILSIDDWNKLSSIKKVRYSEVFVNVMDEISGFKYKVFRYFNIEPYYSYPFLDLLGNWFSRICCDNGTVNLESNSGQYHAMGLDTCNHHNSTIISYQPLLDN